MRDTVFTPKIPAREVITPDLVRKLYYWVVGNRVATDLEAQSAREECLTSD